MDLELDFSRAKYTVKVEHNKSDSLLLQPWIKSGGNYRERIIEL